MYLDYANVKSTSGKIHRRVLLRESYRKQGQVKKRTLANLSALPDYLLRLIDSQIGAKGSAPGLMSVDKLMGSDVNKRRDIFLYDVTSCYFEGQQNELADYGYNRDGKKGKQQIVIGLLIDSKGEPLSIEVFPGNTTDPATCSSRIEEIKRRFGAESITLVGDRGMIKGPQIEKILEAGWNYITAISKPQIKKLLREGVFQLGLFEEEIQEIIDGDLRYVVRKNPVRAEEIRITRQEKLQKLQNKAAGKSKYLAQHPRAKETVAQKDIQNQALKLKIENWVEV